MPVTVKFPEASKAMSLKPAPVYTCILLLLVSKNSCPDTKEVVGAVALLLLLFIAVSALLISERVAGNDWFDIL